MFDDILLQGKYGSFDRRGHPHHFASVERASAFFAHRVRKRSNVDVLFCYTQTYCLSLSPRNKNAITNLYLVFLVGMAMVPINIYLLRAHTFFKYIFSSQRFRFSNSIERLIFLTILLYNVALDGNYTRSAFTDSLNEKNFCRLDKYRETHVGRGNMFTYVKHRFPAESGVRAYTQCLRRK